MHKKHFFKFGLLVLLILIIFVSIEFFTAKAADKIVTVAPQEESTLIVSGLDNREAFRVAPGTMQVELLKTSFNFFSDAPKLLRRITLSIHVGHPAENFDPQSVFSKVSLVLDGKIIPSTEIILDDRTAEPNTIALIFDVPSEFISKENSVSFVADFSEEKKVVDAEIVAYLADDALSLGDRAIDFKEGDVKIQGILSGWTEGTPMGPVVVISE